MTCEKYAERNDSIKETWLNKINEVSDYRFLSAVPDNNKKLGYHTPDEYDFAPLKNWYFIKNFNDFESYDWVFFCDDDLYCFCNRLENLLMQFDHNRQIAIGERMVAKTDMYERFISSNRITYPVPFFAGGGGYAVSRPAILKIKEWISKLEKPEWSYHTDVSFGHWFRFADIELIDRKEMFGSQHWTNETFSHEENFPFPSSEKVSYHYCSKEDMKNLYENFDT